MRSVSVSPSGTLRVGVACPQDLRCSRAAGSGLSVKLPAYRLSDCAECDTRSRSVSEGLSVNPPAYRLTLAFIHNANTLKNTKPITPARGFLFTPVTQSGT